VVLDPVMVATSGDRLLKESAEAALLALLPLADLITPNLAELAILVHEPQASGWAAALEQGKRLAAATGATVLVKGGHLDGGACPDALVNAGGLLSQPVVEVAGDRIPTRNSHGTGCSLSSAMATTQARLGDWEASLRQVKPWLAGALEASGRLEVGGGNGPIHHFHHLQQPAAGGKLAGGEPATAEATTREPAAGEAPAKDATTGELAAGNFAGILRRAAAADLDAIYGLEFIRGLAAGTLPEDQFAYYLAQDAIYLNGYSRALARASALAPTEAAQLFWARSAQQCLEVESELHRTWLSTRTVEHVLGPVTKSYVDHLLATSAAGSYGVLVAALLPCFWLYAEVGQTLHARFLAAGAPESHPYAGWLRTYADEEFAEATRGAVALADQAGMTASAAERAAMLQAFRHSCRFEVDFFDAPRLHA
jgi:hydroxymethylpyrimidine/phosphomethylpyrimidine kinase